jgi:hypothetical protein
MQALEGALVLSSGLHMLCGTGRFFSVEGLIEVVRTQGGRSVANYSQLFLAVVVVNRWDEKAGLRRDAVRSQVIDAL